MVSYFFLETYYLAETWKTQNDKIFDAQVMKMILMPYANNDYPDKLAHTGSLIKVLSVLDPS